MAQFFRISMALVVLAACSATFLLWARTAAFSQDSANGKKKAAKPAEAKPDADLAKFMRKKLDASNQILEGLVTEDTGMIAKGAKALAELSSAEKFQVHHDVMYKQFSNEFQQSAKKLVEAAEKENLDGATLKWIDTTMKCIECHKFVRGLRVAQ